MGAPVLLFLSIVQTMRAPLHCPECNSIYVYRATRKKGLEIIRAWFGLFPFRCLDCDCRFFARRRE